MIYTTNFDFIYFLFLLTLLFICIKWYFFFILLEKSKSIVVVVIVVVGSSCICVDHSCCSIAKAKAAKLALGDKRVFRTLQVQLSWYDCHNDCFMSMKSSFTCKDVGTKIRMRRRVTMVKTLETCILQLIWKVKYLINIYYKITASCN